MPSVGAAGIGSKRSAAVADDCNLAACTNGVFVRLVYERPGQTPWRTKSILTDEKARSSSMFRPASRGKPSLKKRRWTHKRCVLALFRCHSEPRRRRARKLSGPRVIDIEPHADADGPTCDRSTRSPSHGEPRSR
jgi:hypothetical protein